MARQRRFSGLLALAGVSTMIAVGACGGDILREATTGDAGIPIDGSVVGDASPSDAADASTDDASANDSDVPDTAPVVCAPVKKGCFGFMSCEPNSSS